MLFIEELLPSPTWQDSARQAMGQVRRYAESVSLAEMKPGEKLSATRYCLARRGYEYVIFQSNKGEFTVDLTDAGDARFGVEWLNINADATVAGKPVAGGAVRTFTTPFPGPAALLLKRM